MALLLAAAIPALMGASTSIAATAVNPGVGVSPNPVQRGGTATFNWSHGGDCWDNLGHSATGNFSFQMAVHNPFTWRVDCVGGGTNSVFVNVTDPPPPPPPPTPPGVGVNPNPVQRGATATFNWSHGGDCWDNLGHSATGNFSFQMAVWDPFTWTVQCVGGGSQSVDVGVIAPSPIGHFDQVNSDGVASGWACDGDNWSAPLEIHFYSGGPAGSGIFAGSTTANATREPAVAGNCGGVHEHGFAFLLPLWLRDGHPHTLYVYAINIGGGSNTHLGGSPKTFTAWSGPQLVTPPAVSPPGPVNEGDELTTTTGSWSGTVTDYQFEWLRNGVPIPGEEFENYFVTEEDLGANIKSRITACAPTPCNSAQSSNAVYVNRPPAIPTGRSPADGTASTNANPTLSAVCSDPEGDACMLAFEIYRASDFGFVGSGQTGWLGSGSTGSWSPPTLPAGQWYVWFVQALDNRGAGSDWSADWAYRVGRLPGVSLLSPADGATLPTATPVLSASASDADGDELAVAFEVASDSGFGTIVANSGWMPQATSTWTVPSGTLKDGRTYWWRVRADDGLEGETVSAARRFDVRLPKLGVRDYWPMWSRGPVAVNLATGNLVVAVPGPSYPTAVGSMAASATYNRHDTGNRGLGPGWMVSAGDELGSPPAKLVDHNLLSGAERYDAVERVSADGSSDFYTRVGQTNTYQSAPGDGSQLVRSADGSWTLSDPDGAIYVFGATPTNGAFPLVSGELADAKPGKGILRYVFGSAPGSPDPLRVTQVRDSAPGLPPGRTLTFAWNSINAAACSTALLCVTGPDGVTWRYIGDAQGRLARINDGTRDVLALGYDASGRLNKVQNANDLDPAGAGAGYNGTHSIVVAYDGAGRVASVSEGPVTNQTPATSTWSFAYTPGIVPVTRATQAAHGAMAQGTVRSAEGYAEVTPPRQQGLPSPKRSRVYYDNLAHPLESIDLLGNVTSNHYNDKDQLLWTEDELGHPTDHTYDTVNDVLVSVKGPDPDGPGPLGRPETIHRYDEIAISRSGGEGPKLEGLQGWYYKNKDLVGRPHARKTDAVVDFQWGSGGPSVLDGIADNFSVRWSGNLVVPAGGAGAYTFTTVSGDDDGTRLVIDGVAAIDDWSQAATTVSSQPIQLTVGAHKITLDYREQAGPAQVQLKWACSGCTPAVIPSSRLRPAWMNQTSTVSPTGRLSFSHFADPSTGLPDYTLQSVDGADLVTTFVYDDHGRITQKVMPKGNAGRTIAANGDLQGTPDTRFATTWTYYAPADTAAVPALAPCAGATVNQAALLKEMSTHGLAPVTHVYDAAGASVKTTKGAGDTVRCYDAEGRLKSERAPGVAQATTFTYDPAGRQLSTTDASGTIATEYDEAGRVKRTIDSFGAEATFTYDAEGNQIRRKAAKGPFFSTPQHETVFGYDELGRLSGLTDPAGKAYTFFYDKRDSLKATQYPNGTFSWNDYNQAGWLTAVHNRHGTLSAPLPVLVPSDASPIVDFTYAYNLEGQRTQETRSGGGIPSETTTYVYDTLGRLQQATLPNGSSRRYCFDRDSNRTEITSSAGAACGSPNPAASYVYDPAQTPGVDQLTSVTEAGQTRTFSYNSDGDVTRRGADTLQWDGQGRLKGGIFSGRSVSYGFDAEGFRRERTVAVPSYRSDVLAHSPTSYWRLGEPSGTTMTDERGANAGTYLNGVTLGAQGALTGDQNTSASFDVVDDYANVPNSATLNPSSQLTLEAWVKPRTGYFNRQKPILLKSYTSHNLPYYQYGLFLHNSSGNRIIRFSLALNGTHTNLDISQSGWQVGVWNHIAATYDGQTMRVYLNGTELGSRTASGTITAYSTPLMIAAYQNLSKTGPNLFAGEIDELAIYPTALPAAAIQAHYGSAQSATSTTRYLLGGLFETTAAGSLTHTDVDGAAGDLAHYQGAPATGTTLSYLYYNGHGDLAATANETGARTNAFTYDPFGAPLQAPPADSAVERYTGRWDKKLDVTTGLIEMGARPYDPVLGRFLAVDPVEGGALNNYDYAGQDAINGYDLDGRCKWGLPCPKPLKTVGKALKAAGSFAWKHRQTIAINAAILIVSLALPPAGAALWAARGAMIARSIAAARTEAAALREGTRLLGPQLGGLMSRNPHIRANSRHALARRASAALQALGPSPGKRSIGWGDIFKMSRAFLKERG